MTQCSAAGFAHRVEFLKYQAGSSKLFGMQGVCYHTAVGSTFCTVQQYMSSAPRLATDLACAGVVSLSQCAQCAGDLC
jgi:hypothetical protein